MDRWPNFFIVGAPKAGTTSLYEYLKKIPGIYMSPVKEPGFFSSTITPIGAPKFRGIKSKNVYLKLFRDAKNEKVLGEASPSYLVYYHEVARLIHNISPASKILISLRDPIERLFSSYLMQSRTGFLKLSFSDELENSLKKREKTDWSRYWIDIGLYFEGVKTYLNVFGPKQVKIIIFEEWIKNPKNTIQEILKFLEIENEINDFKPEAYNPYGVPRGPIAKYLFQNKKIRDIAQKTLSSERRKTITENFLLKKTSKPKLDEKSRSMLTKYYVSDVKKLEDLLGRKLPWPNFQIQ